MPGKDGGIAEVLRRRAVVGHNHARFRRGGSLVREALREYLKRLETR
jgi:hypothetical protein